MSNRTSQKKIWIRSGLTIGLVFLIVTGVWFVMARKDDKSAIVNTASSAISTKPQVQDPLTGVLVDEAHVNQQIYAVMIDEHMDARPQNGIDQAFLVIEAPVEAGIPRLLAFFSEDQNVEKIGPVRSARPYFIDWALEFDALYVHVGGSNEALAKIKNGSTFDLNQFWHDQEFWRATDRNAPHNVYTKTDLLGVYVETKQTSGRTSSPLYGVWKFKEVDPNVAEKEQEFSISYVAPDYVTSWSFDSVAKNYVSSNKEIERTNEATFSRPDHTVRAENVVVIVTDVAIIDAIGRRNVRTTGEGKAFVFQDGEKINGTWKKLSASERLRFFDRGGNEIAMNAGVTWIEVVGDESQLEEIPLAKIQEGRD